MRFEFQHTLGRPLLGALSGALLVHAAMAALFGYRLLTQRDDPLGPAAALAAVSLVVESEEPARSDEDPQQFVSLSAPDEEQTPDDARFFDRFDRAVERESVSADDVLLLEAPPPVPISNQGGAVAMRAGVTGTSDRLSRPSVPRVRLLEGSSTTPEPGEGDPTSSSGVDTPSSSGADGGGTGARGDGADEIDLRAFNAIGAGADVLVRRNDHLELAEADRTMLNSLRSTYWSFFNRMQQRLSQEWRPGVVLRRFDPTGELYGSRDRYTVLSVTLESDGSLRHALVTRSSELDFLDAEAIRAFEACAPFQNVPESMKDENGRVTFRFGFYVDVNGSPRVRRIQ